MRRLILTTGGSLIAIALSAQTDIDAIRYSGNGVGGSARFLAMGGAFGAVGADVGCAATNPAGLGLYRNGELSFTGGLKITNNSGDIYGRTTRVSDAAFVFNNFGLALAWDNNKDPDSRHVIAFSNTQLSNFLGSTRMSGYTNNSSIAKDMLNLSYGARTVDDLNNYYERMGFETYLIDTLNGSYISMLDTRRSVLQTRDIVTSGRTNELNFSYAYSYKDKYYLGASVGVPRIEYNSTTTHSESDDRDSMRIVFTSPNSYTHTYIGGLPEINDYYSTRGGFNSLEYDEYFRTTGSGLNLKLGGVARVNDNLRLGFYYHTATIYKLTDVYMNNMYTTWDMAPSKQDKDQYPSEEGYYQYRLITPGRIGVNGAWLFGKKGLIAIDYEAIDYSKAQLKGQNIKDFANVNSDIARKYTTGHNVRIGGEYNLSPIMLRAGYSMQGSPFGHVFTGDFVRHAISAGIGFRPGRGFFVDAAWVQSFSTENYFPFITMATEAKIRNSAGMLSLTAGIKF